VAHRPRRDWTRITKTTTKRDEGNQGELDDLRSAESHGGPRSKLIAIPKRGKLDVQKMRLLRLRSPGGSSNRKGNEDTEDAILQRFRERDIDSRSLAACQAAISASAPSDQVSEIDDGVIRNRQTSCRSRHDFLDEVEPIHKKNAPKIARPSFEVWRCFEP